MEGEGGRGKKEKGEGGGKRRVERQTFFNLLQEWVVRGIHVYIHSLMQTVSTATCISSTVTTVNNY